MSAASAKHELAFDAALHAYTLDGVPVPAVTSVTDILDKPQLDDWRAKIGYAEAERIAAEAARFGTAVHAAVAAKLRGQRLLAMDFGERWLPTLELLFAWFDENLLEALHIEETMASPAMKVAGKPDLVARLVGHRRPTIIDYKTGRGVYAGARLQQAAYRTIVREWTGLVCDRLILHLPAPAFGEAPQLHPIPLRGHGNDEAAFRAALVLWHWNKGLML